MSIKAALVQDADRAKFAEALTKAMQANDEAATAKAFTDFFANVEAKILKQAENFDTERADKALYAQRGLRVLSNAEEKFFKGFIDAAKSDDVQKALMDFSEVLPESEINAVFEDLAAEHPLLEAVDFQNTSALTKLIFDSSETQMAVWGELTSAITKELEGSVKIVELVLNKLTAFMYMSNDMLDLGPIWVEKYVRTILAEALAVGLEDGIINGIGKKGQPIGMIREISADVSVNETTGYPEKTAISVTDFSPTTYGDLASKLAVNETGKSRTVTSVVLIVNPVDYLQKVMPATTMLQPNGLYAHDVFPLPTTVYQSAAVKSGKAILGRVKQYKLGVGVGSSKGKIEADTSLKFLEDLKTYKIKLYANGRAKDNNCFLYLDISKLQPITYANLTANVNVTNTATQGAAG